MILQLSVERRSLPLSRLGRGAGLLPVRFPRSLAEPAVEPLDLRLSSASSFFVPGGLVIPTVAGRQRERCAGIGLVVRLVRRVRGAPESCRPAWSFTRRGR